MLEKLVNLRLNNHGVVHLIQDEGRYYLEDEWAAGRKDDYDTAFEALVRTVWEVSQ